jgi:hypothetical protein
VVGTFLLVPPRWKRSADELPADAQRAPG